MVTGSNSNNALVTISTGTIMNEDAVGLVGGHAYAVLEVIEWQGHKMLLVKNPWGHFRWNGKWSYGDKAWTPQMKSALGYDNLKEDKGVFWMDYSSVLQNFDRIHINWNPDLLEYRKSYFDYWSLEQMRKYDSRVSLKENPQYYIKFGQPNQG